VRAEVRRADRSDVDVVSQVLADAFADYPWTRWTVDGEAHGERVQGLQRLAMESLVLPYGEAWVAVDEAGDVVGAALWMLPNGSVPASVFTEMGAEVARLEGSRHAASIAAEALVSPLRPVVPHYYLGAVGTRRDRQRRGYGASVIAPVLDRARAERAPVFLETSEMTNVEFYRRLGFVTVAELDIPGGGPHVWAMQLDK
jgi:GNAT superfamily N-acetyltransferase